MCQINHIHESWFVCVCVWGGGGGGGGGGGVDTISKKQGILLKITLALVLIQCGDEQPQTGSVCRPSEN